MRRILVKSWLCLLLNRIKRLAERLYSAFQSRDKGSRQRNPTSSTQHRWSVPWQSQLFQTDEAFAVDGRKHTHTHTNTQQQQQQQQQQLRYSTLRKKVSVFGVLLVRILPHSDWMKNSEYEHFSRSANKYVYNRLDGIKDRTKQLR